MKAVIFFPAIVLVIMTVTHLKSQLNSVEIMNFPEPIKQIDITIENEALVSKIDWVGRIRFFNRKNGGMIVKIQGEQMKCNFNVGYTIGGDAIEAIIRFEGLRRAHVETSYRIGSTFIEKRETFAVSQACERV
ncbi:MAG: hypothetical protein AAFY84_03290 [Pseudomonadota bacterium]